MLDRCILLCVVSRLDEDCNPGWGLRSSAPAFVCFAEDGVGAKKKGKFFTGLCGIFFTGVFILYNLHLRQSAASPLSTVAVCCFFCFLGFGLD